MAKYSSGHKNTGQMSAQAGQAGFGVPEAAKSKKSVPKWVKLSLVAAAAGALGVGLSLMGNEADTPEDNALRFGIDTREAQSYMQLVIGGRIDYGDPVVRAANDLMSLHEVTPYETDTGDFAGVEYEDVTAAVHDRDMNASLFPHDYQLRDMNRTLDNLATMSTRFDIETGMVQPVVLDDRDIAFDYHIFSGDDGAQIRIISTDYYDANEAAVNGAVQQSENLWPDLGIHKMPWLAFSARVSEACYDTPECNG